MLRSLACAAAALAAVAASSAASAQDVPNIISPLRVESDHNGVNLVGGQMTMEMPTLSAPGAPNLKFDRVQNAAPYVLGKAAGMGADAILINYSVHTGQGTEAFRCDGGTCTSVLGTGSTFGGNSYVQAGTGARFNFHNKHLDNTRTTTNGTAQYYLSNIFYPNGETISYGYDTVVPGDFLNRTWYRPTSISSSLGFVIMISYQSNDFNSVYWGTPSEAALYQGANLIKRLAYSGNTITDYGSNAANVGGRVYTCTGCNNALGSNLETGSGTQRLPGEAADTLQVAQSSQAGVNAGKPIIASVTRDGVAWNYSYANLRYDLQTLSYWYDSLTVTGPNGFNQVYNMRVYDKRNVMTSVRDPILRTTIYDFDAGYRPIRVVQPEGNQVTVLYDEYGNVTSRTTTPKAGQGSAVTETASFRTDCGLVETSALLCYRPLWSRDGLNRQTDYVYNAQGQLTEQTDPADQNGVRKKTYITYESSTGVSRRSVVRVCGLGTTCGTANEIRTEYSYWGSTLLPSSERRIDAAQGVTLETTYTYDPAGRPLSVDGPLPGSDDASYLRYDPFGRKSWEIGAKAPNGLRLAKKFTYRDADDKLVATEEGTVTDPANPVLTPLTRTDLAYDSHRNPVRETVSAAGTTHSLVQRSFDDRGRLDCEARRMNPAVFGAPPANACALGTQGTGAGDYGPDRITHNVYDAASQLLQVQRAYATSLQQNYASYTYSANGKQTSVTDANNNRAELTWDGFDRQKRWIFPSNTAGVANQGDYEEYGYDAVGNRITLRKRDGVTLGFQYDALNRVTVKNVPASATGAPGYSVFYGYDAQGLQTYARFGSAAGAGITNSYDGFGRLTSSTTNMDGTQRTFTYTLDVRGNRTVITSGSGYYAGYDYDAIGRMTMVREGGGAVVAQLGYEPGGKRSSLGLGTGGAVTSAAGYGYDAVARLQTLTRDLAGTTADENRTFAYNPASQIVTRTLSNDAFASNTAYNVSRAYSVNGLNQYTTAGPASFLYDANGNLKSDGSTSFVYDTENRLVSASGAKNASLAYDPLGRLWQISSGGSTTRFVYDGDKLVEEYNGSGGWLRAYIHGPGTDEPLVWYDFTAGFNRYFLHADQQGSVVALADLYGNATTINGYDPWGIPNANNAGRFQYTGQSWLAELGMYYYKARIYSPTLGRFMQTDPVGYNDQINLYAYVGNDPLNRNDPTGLRSCPKPDQPCPDIVLPPREIRERLAAAVGRPSGDEEAGGQALQNVRTRAIRYRTGSEAGQGRSGEFAHSRTPPGERTLLRSHTHYHNSNERGLEGASRQRGQNAPSRDDQTAMHNNGRGGRAVQTIGPDVTTTMFRRDRQDYLVVDSGNRSRIPDLRSQGIIVLDADPE